MTAPRLWVGRGDVTPDDHLLFWAAAVERAHSLPTHDSPA